VAAGAAGDLASDAGPRAQPARELEDRVVVQRADLLDGGHVAEDSEHVVALARPDGSQHEGRVAGQPAHQEVQELERRRARVLEVVDEQQDRPATGQAAEERRDRLERAAPFDVRRRADVADRAQDGSELGQDVR
jgi:hypothetical protein